MTKALLKRMIVVLAVVAFVFADSALAEDLTPELCKEKVIAASQLMATEGEGAIAKIKDANGEFRFAGGKGYIWIHNLDGMMVMHPIKPALDGKDVLQTTDPNGVPLFANMNDLVGEKKAGWVGYHWPKPGEKDASPKMSYVKLVEKDGKDYVLGAGMYDVTAADIKTKFPSDAIYE